MNNPGSSGDKGERTVLFVHGRDFKPNVVDFADLSFSALAAGISRDYPDVIDQFNELDKRVAYYGDLTDDFLTNQGLRYDETLDIGDRKNALIMLSAFEKKKNFGVNRYDRLPGKTAMGEFAADVFAPLLGAIGLSKKLLRKVGVDLAEYWNSKSYFGDKIRDRVRIAICEALDDEKQVLLISHGTGCIVTYDVLWQLSHAPEYKEAYKINKIDLWLTLGSPLGDSMVRRRILGSRRKGLKRYPSNIVSWHNVSAEDDFVSHDNTVANDYREMLKQKQVSCIRDYRIYNMAIRYGKSNPHNSLGYLIHPRTAQIVAEWLQQGPSAPLAKSIS